MTVQEAIDRPILTPAQIEALVHTRRIKENDNYVITVDGDVYWQERNANYPALREFKPSFDLNGSLHVTLPVTDPKTNVTADKNFKLDDLMATYFPKSVTPVATRNVTPAKKSVTPNINLKIDSVTGGVTSSSVTPSKKSEASTGAANPKVLGHYIICGTRYESARAAAKALDTNVNNVLRKVTANHPDYQFIPDEPLFDK